MHVTFICLYLVYCSFLPLPRVYNKASATATKRYNEIMNHPCYFLIKLWHICNTLYDYTKEDFINTVLDLPYVLVLLPVFLLFTFLRNRLTYLMDL